MLTPSALVDLLKNKLEQFPRHRFNVQQTAKTYDNLVANLNEHTILKIHNFSETYTCLLPEEIQSLHWNQEQATVYPIVVLRKVGEEVREDHLIFISEDRKHDVPFVELCNDMLHKHYQDDGLSITVYPCVQQFGETPDKDNTSLLRDKSWKVEIGWSLGCGEVLCYQGCLW